jgi:hypothetical protein
MMEDQGKSEKILEGYQPERRGYQPIEAPAAGKPPQGGSGTIPVQSEKPNGQESEGEN